MVGGAALRLGLDHPAVSSVAIIGRRSVDFEHDKMTEFIHGDFLDYEPIAEAFQDCDVALYCLGAYTGTVPDAEFRRITVDYTVAFAKALFAQSPQATFCFLSGAGADQTEKSRMSFARYKGAAEKALLAIGFSRVHLFRPGYIYPVTPRKEPNLTYRISRAVYPVLNLLAPGLSIPSTDLAKTMLLAGLDGTGDHANPILENRDIRKLAGLKTSFFGNSFTV